MRALSRTFSEHLRCNDGPHQTDRTQWLGKSHLARFVSPAFNETMRWTAFGTTDRFPHPDQAARIADRVLAKTTDHGRRADT